MRKLFGTDGVRGIANIHPMTAEVALQLGRAIAHIFKKEPRRHKIVIGKDTRLSGYMLENAMVTFICSMGGDIIIIGTLPTLFFNDPATMAFSSIYPDSLVSLPI